MALFLLLAASMLAAALAFVLPTLLRGGAAHDPGAQTQHKLKALDAARAAGILSDAEYDQKRSALGTELVDALAAPRQRTRSTWLAIFGIALLLPAIAILLYRYIGDPRALDAAALTAPVDHGQNMEQAIADLAAKLKQNPDDIEGWTLLGRAYEATGHFAEARDALGHAHDLAPNDPDITVAYAQELAMASDTRRIEGEPRALIEAVLKAAPDNERGLWLLGISEYQAKRYDSAIAAWKHMIAVLPKDSDIAPSVQEQIAQAEAERDGRAPPPEAGIAPAATAAANDGTAAAAEAGPRLQVEVALDPKFKDKLSPQDVLFVYAKAANGPPMPLAIQRMSANKLPVAIALTDGMGMLPNMKLSQFPQVVIGARVSKSGNAIAQSGDFQTLSPPLAVSTSTPIKLTIDQIVP
jgi:cytochrome c-type biogenesis protein CcmH